MDIEKQQKISHNWEIKGKADEKESTWTSGPIPIGLYGWVDLDWSSTAKKVSIQVCYKLWDWRTGKRRFYYGKTYFADSDGKFKKTITADHIIARAWF